jgi:GTP-binding protein YchF
MGFKCGIVGLPNVGKSTIFNALTNASAEVASFPFSTIKPNLGIVPVPDERLKVLEKFLNPKKVTPTFLNFVDIAGLVKGASQGEGLGNEFLSHIREVDVIAHVVRCFESQEIPHIYGYPDPERDAEVVNLELILSDLQLVSRRLEKLARLTKTSPKKELREEEELLKELEKWLSEGKRAKEFLEVKKVKLPKDLPLITDKPYFYLANVNGENHLLEKLLKVAEKENVPVVKVFGKLELELQEFSVEEREALRRELGMETSLLEVVKVGYKLLELVTFFTTAHEDLRAWTVKKGTKAPEAAGKIHSDMQKGFIRVEVINFEDLIKVGSEKRARELGLVRFEGKEYEIKDGDILYFRFSL